MVLSTRKMLPIAAVVALALVTTITMAQPQTMGRSNRGFSMGGGGMTPDYMLRDLARFEMALELQPEQVMIVEQILREYDESFREASNASRESIGDSFRSMRGSEDDPARQASQAMRDRMREIRDKIDSTRRLGDEDGMTELRARLNKELESLREERQQLRTEQWQSTERQTAFEEVALLMQDQLRLKRSMKDELEGDLVAILTEDQEYLWPPLQRQLIRDRLLPRGRISGERLDVMGLVDQQKYDDEILATLVLALSDWDIQVTVALTTRDDHMVQNQGELMASMRTLDSNASLGIMKTQAKLAESVRDINDLAVENITLLLPTEIKDTFNSIAKERGYPRIYRPSRADRAFNAAMEIDELEPDILLAVSELYEAMKAELLYANERIYEATHRWEAQEQLDRMGRFAQRMSGSSSERPESPIRKAQDARSLIENTYLEQLKMLLTPEQIEALGGLETQSRSQQRGANGNNRSSQRRGGFEGGREEFMKRFDKNGDGSIDDSERESIRDFFRNGGARGGMGGSPQQ